jgi:hypothetical protein
MNIIMNMSTMNMSIIMGIAMSTAMNTAMNITEKQMNTA